ncbi:MAG: DUF503 domain-containing protein [Euzebyales bacterium]|nr:DUF503 domain-containing protein [Euzebyales bacterium]
MIAALVEVELHVPGVASLKGKRAVVKSLLAALRQQLNVSAVEVDHQDLWQRTTLGVAIAAGSETGARTVAQQVEKIVYREPRVEPIAFRLEIAATER